MAVCVCHISACHAEPGGSVGPLEAVFTGGWLQELPGVDTGN